MITRKLCGCRLRSALASMTAAFAACAFSVSVASAQTQTITLIDPASSFHTTEITESAPPGDPTVSNACTNSVSANFSQIEVTTSGDDGLPSVPPGDPTTLSGLNQSAAIPGAIFVAGYNLGLLQVGENTVDASVQTKIEATNTVQGTQTTNTEGGSPPDGSVTVTTTITDPNGTPGTGDETATAGSFAVSYDNLSWTAGPSGTINYRQDSIATAPPTQANNTLLINVLLPESAPGVRIPVQFRCAPGTVVTTPAVVPPPKPPLQPKKKKCRRRRRARRAPRPRRRRSARRRRRRRSRRRKRDFRKAGSATCSRTASSR